MCKRKFHDFHGRRREPFSRCQKLRPRWGKTMVCRVGSKQKWLLNGFRVYKITIKRHKYV